LLDDQRTCGAVVQRKRRYVSRKPLIDFAPIKFVVVPRPCGDAQSRHNRPASSGWGRCGGGQTTRGGSYAFQRLRGSSPQGENRYSAFERNRITRAQDAAPDPRASAPVQSSKRAAAIVSTVSNSAGIVWVLSVTGSCSTAALSSAMAGSPPVGSTIFAISASIASTTFGRVCLGIRKAVPLAIPTVAGWRRGGALSPSAATSRALR
jgi:hypothetical protein